MRIPSGVTDQYIYFVATLAGSRVTGLSSFTVYRSRNGAAATAMTTPTINETDSTNMPGVYELLLDEDMTIATGNDSEEMAFHISEAGMDDVTSTIELYLLRPDRLLLLETTVAVVNSQTNFQLTDGAPDKDAYNNCTVVFQDATTPLQVSIGLIDDFVDSPPAIILKYDPAVFTIAVGDKVYILAENSLKATAFNRHLDITASGNAGIDWANIENPSTAVDLAGTDIQLCDTATAVTNPVSADTTKISGSVEAADNLEASARGIITGIAQTGTLSTTQATTDLAGFLDNELIGRVIVFTGGIANGQASTITDYASASGLVTFNAIATAPANNDTFVIV